MIKFSDSKVFKFSLHFSSQLNSTNAELKSGQDDLKLGQDELKSDQDNLNERVTKLESSTADEEKMKELQKLLVGYIIMLYRGFQTIGVTSKIGFSPLAIADGL